MKHELTEPQQVDLHGWAVVCSCGYMSRAFMKKVRAEVAGRRHKETMERIEGTHD